MKTTMTLSKALKVKNSLVKSLNKINNVLKHNSCNEENSALSIELKPKWDEYDQTSRKLVSLKTAISKANVDINEKIFMISELKAKIEKFRLMPTEQGMVDRMSRFGTSSETSVKKVVQYSEEMIENLIKGFEQDIEALQDDIDTYNATHFIEIED